MVQEQQGNQDDEQYFINLMQELGPEDRAKYESQGPKIRRLFETEDFKIVLGLIEKLSAIAANNSARSHDAMEVYRQQGRYLGLQDLLWNCRNIVKFAEKMGRKRKEKFDKKNKQEDIDYE